MLISNLQFKWGLVHLFTLIHLGFLSSFLLYLTPVESGLKPSVKVRI